jgi:Leucine-rich repeat (LRR) protein
MEDKEEKICDRFFSYAKGMKGLIALDAKNSDVSDAGIAHIGRNDVLKRIDITSTLISKKSLVNLSKCSSLNELFASSNDLKLDAADVLPSFPKLIRMSLAKTRLPSHYLSSISGSPKLKELDLSGNLELDDSCLQYIKSLKHLEVLRINNTRVNPEAIFVLKGLPLSEIAVNKGQLNAKMIQRLEKTFPGVYVARNRDSKPVDKDLKYIFSPLR